MLSMNVPRLFDFDRDLLYPLYQTIYQNCNLNYKVHDGEDSKIVEVEVPGIRPENISVELEGRALIVDAGKDLSLYLTLGSRIEQSSVKAEYIYGKLLITLPINKPKSTNVPIEVIYQ